MSLERTFGVEPESYSHYEKDALKAIACDNLVSLPVDNTCLAKEGNKLYPPRGEVKLSV